MQVRFDPRTFREMEALAASMEAMDPAIQDYLWGEMTFAAARRYAREAQANPPFHDRTGNLRYSIRAVRKDVPVRGVGVIRNGQAYATMGNRYARQAHLIEFGTRERTQRTTGRRTGKVDARHVMTHVFDTKSPEAIQDGINAGKRQFNRMVAAARRNGQGLSRRARRVLGGG